MREILCDTPLLSPLEFVWDASPAWVATKTVIMTTRKKQARLVLTSSRSDGMKEKEIEQLKNPFNHRVKSSIGPKKFNEKESSGHLNSYSTCKSRTFI